MQAQETKQKQKREDKPGKEIVFADADVLSN
jgi:hypothetical protein